MALSVVYLALALLAAASAAPEVSRIVGGTPTTVEQFPYVVALTYTYPAAGITVQRCVGGLLSSWHVVTSGYCYTGAIEDNMKIRAGSTTSLSGGTVVSIGQVIKHPSYLEAPRQGDIAVTLTAEPILMSASVGILQVPYQNYPIADGSAAEVVSWGFEYIGGPQLELLKTITVNKINVADCQNIYQGNDNVLINDNVICASAPGVGMCNGDSGAPMVIDGVVVGISSYFQECGDDAYPDVFTRIDQYSNWIMEVAVAPGRVGDGIRSKPTRA